MHVEMSLITFTPSLRLMLWILDFTGRVWTQYKPNSLRFISMGPDDALATSFICTMQHVTRVLSFFILAFEPVVDVCSHTTMPGLSMPTNCALTVTA